MARIRKTISFKPNVLKALFKRRGDKELSTYLNEHLEKTLDLKECEKS